MDVSGVITIWLIILIGLNTMGENYMWGQRLWGGKDEMWDW